MIEKLRSLLKVSDCSWFAEGVLIIFFCLEKRWGALIGAGALKGANTV